MNFSQAFKLFGPDVETIAEETGIPPHEVNRLINVEMDSLYAEKLKKEKRRVYQRDHMRRVRAELREIRERASA